MLKPIPLKRDTTAQVASILPSKSSYLEVYIKNRGESTGKSNRQVGSSRWKTTSNNRGSKDLTDEVRDKSGSVERKGSKSTRRVYIVYKKILDAVFLLMKKKVSRNRSNGDNQNMEIYLQVLNEKLSRKDNKMEKPNKKIMEVKRNELTALKMQLEGLMKELEVKREFCEVLRKFQLDFFDQLYTYFPNFCEDTSELFRTQTQSRSKDDSGKLKKISSGMNIGKTATLLKAVTKFKNKSGDKSRKDKKEDEITEANLDDIHRQWDTKRRVNMKSNMVKVNNVKGNELDNRIINKEERKEGLVRGEQNETGHQTVKVGSGGIDKSDTAANGAVNEVEIEYTRKPSLGTTRYVISQNHIFNRNDGILNKDNLRKNLMKDEHEKIEDLSDFVKLKRRNSKVPVSEIEKLLQAKNKIEEKEEVESCDSNLNESMLEEAKQDLRIKMIKQNYGEYVEGDEFKYKVVVPNFYPVKVSFKVEIGLNRQGTDNVVVKSDRIFKNFQIYEIESHFKNKSMCGLRLVLKNFRTDFLLGGNFHGKIGDFVDICRFDLNEAISKIEYGHDALSIRFLEFSTTKGQRHTVGIQRNEAVVLGLSFVTRYYPQELMLCKFFCQFNKHSQYIGFFRFLFLRTVLY